jgi:mRNA interferase YafQ
MLLPVFENRFKKDIKRLQKRGKDLKKLKTVIEKLLENQEPCHQHLKFLPLRR